MPNGTVSQKVIKPVIPAEAGIDTYLKKMVFRLRGYDIEGLRSTFAIVSMWIDTVHSSAIIYKNCIKSQKKRVAFLGED